MGDKKRSRRNTQKRKKRPIIIAIALLVIFATGALAGYNLLGPGADQDNDGMPDIVPTKKMQPINILVVGNDQRGDERARADVIIIARLRPEDKEVSLLSIPRDTRVPIEGHGEEKINHALAYGDIELLTKTIEDFTGLNIDYYMKTNFKGFENIIDILGGVTIDVEKKMYYKAEDINIKPGLQTLNGHDALGYVRFRSDGLGDMGRVERQHKFLDALLAEVKDMSFNEAMQVGKEVLENVKTDMPLNVMTKYGKKFVGITTEQLEMYTVPGTDLRDGLWYWIADEEKMKVVLDEFMNGKPEPVVDEEQSGASA